MILEIPDCKKNSPSVLWWEYRSKILEEQSWIPKDLRLYSVDCGGIDETINELKPKMPT